MSASLIITRAARHCHTEVAMLGLMRMLAGLCWNRTTHPLNSGRGMNESSLASTLKTSPPTRNWKASMAHPDGRTVAWSSTAMLLYP
ncbi:MAG: hypothetical protein ACK56F_24770, partial [bacterium]